MMDTCDTMDAVSSFSAQNVLVFSGSGGHANGTNATNGIVAATATNATANTNAVNAFGRLANKQVASQQWKKSKSLEDVRVENIDGSQPSHEMEFVSNRIQKLKVHE